MVFLTPIEPAEAFCLEYRGRQKSKQLGWHNLEAEKSVKEAMFGPCTCHSLILSALLTKCPQKILMQGTKRTQKWLNGGLKLFVLFADLRVEKSTDETCLLHW